MLIVIPACDGLTNRQTDGIDVASTALAKRRAVKIALYVAYSELHGVLYKRCVVVVVLRCVAGTCVAYLWIVPSAVLRYA